MLAPTVEVRHPCLRSAPTVEVRTPVLQIGSDSVWELHLANVMVVGSNPELRCIVAGRWDDLTERTGSPGHLNSEFVRPFSVAKLSSSRGSIATVESSSSDRRAAGENIWDARTQWRKHSTVHQVTDSLANFYGARRRGTTDDDTYSGAASCVSALASVNEAAFGRATPIDVAELVILVATLLVLVWALSKNGYGNEYYAAAVRSMTYSWRNFVYGAADPGGWITTDKPPLALWLGALSARVFGFSSWSILLPSAVCGVATVALVMATVRRAGEGGRDEQPG